MPLTVGKSELLVDGDDAVFRQVVHNSLGFASRIQEIRNRLGESIGLSGPAYSILISIEHLTISGEVGVNRIGDHLHLSGAFVTIEVSKLVKAGLVKKAVHPADGRRVLLSVTDQARDRLSQLAPIQQPVNDTIFGGLSAKQFHAFSIIVSSLVSGTEEALALLQLLGKRSRRRG